MDEYMIRALATATLAPHLPDDAAQATVAALQLPITGAPPEEIAAAVVALTGKRRDFEEDGIGPQQAFENGFNFALILGARIATAPLAANDKEILDLIVIAREAYREQSERSTTNRTLDRALEGALAK